MTPPDRPPAGGAVAGMTIVTAMLLGLAVFGLLGSLLGSLALGLMVGAFVGIAAGTYAVIVRFR